LIFLKMYLTFNYYYIKCIYFTIFTVSRKFISFRSILIFVLKEWSWGSSVSTVSDYRLDDRVSIPRRDKGFFP
jgi:hypothetical protein